MYKEPVILSEIFEEGTTYRLNRICSPFPPYEPRVIVESQDGCGSIRLMELESVPIPVLNLLLLQVKNG